MTNREAIDVLSQFACPGVLGVKNAINMAIDALKEKEDCLSIDELHALLDDNCVGHHIWVKEINSFYDGLVSACVLDNHYAYGLVAVYGACDEEEWFIEENYGKTWVAYLEKPV